MKKYYIPVIGLNYVNQIPYKIRINFIKSFAYSIYQAVMLLLLCIGIVLLISI